ncbi:MAG: COG1361 S-layer family protein [Thermoprotei archaeon]
MKTLYVVLVSALLLLGSFSMASAQTAGLRPDFLVVAATWGSKSSPIVASPGDSNLPLFVELVNEGGSAVNANATLKLWGPFYYSYYTDGKLVYSREETVRLGTVESGGQALGAFFISIKADASDGVYVIPLTISSDGFTQDLNLSVPITGYASIKVVGVGYNPPSMFPGEQDVELEAYVVNDGTSLARNATVYLSLPSGFSPAWGNSTVHEIGVLPVGTEVPVQFYFNVGSVKSPSNYTARMIISWTGGSESVPITFMIYGKASFSVISTSGYNLTQGGSGQKLYVTLKNSGNYTANYVTFDLITPNEFSGVTTDYAGSLQPGQQDIVRFELDTTSNAKPTTYNLTLQVTWYQNNSEVPFTSYIPIQVHVKQSLINSIGSDLSSAKIGSNSLLLVLLIVVIFLLGILIGVLGRRGKAQTKG